MSAGSSQDFKNDGRGHNKRLQIQLLLPQPVSLTFGVGAGSEHWGAVGLQNCTTGALWPTAIWYVFQCSKQFFPMPWGTGIEQECAHGSGEEQQQKYADGQKEALLLQHRLTTGGPAANPSTQTFRLMGLYLLD